MRHRLIQFLTCVLVYTVPGDNMGAFRAAQAGGDLVLPSDRLPHAFIAQAFDAGEPWTGPVDKCAKPYGRDAPYVCAPNSIGAPFTPMFMGK